MIGAPALGSFVIAWVPVAQRYRYATHKMRGVVVGFSFARDAAIIRSRAGDGAVQTEVAYDRIIHEQSPGIAIR